MLAGRKLIISGVTAALLVGGAGVATASTLHKEVTLVVDGKSIAVDGWVNTVGDVLAKSSVTLEQQDIVSPSAAASVQDGETITVTRVRSKQVTITHDGTTTPVTTFASTVAGALGDAGVSVGIDDRVSSDLTSELTDGETVTVQRVKVTTEQTTEAIPFGSSTTKDASLTQGTKKVTTKGVDGVRTTTFQIVTVDGVQESRTQVDVSETPAVDQVTALGTKVVTTTPASTSTSTSTDGLNLANAAMWDKVAQCESGGNWHINTGNGYYGGLQFLTSTWLAWGGGAYAPRADLASREQQITIANKLYAKSGLASWGCKA